MAKEKVVPAGKVNKAAYIRSLPGSLSGKEMVKHAKVRGIEISILYVHRIRSMNRRQGKVTVARPIARHSKLRSRNIKSPSSPSGRAAIGDTAVRAIERVAKRKVTIL